MFKLQKLRFNTFDSKCDDKSNQFPMKRYIIIKFDRELIHKSYLFLQIPSYQPTELRTNAIYVQLYVVWMRFIIIEMIPYVTICLLNTRIIVK